MGRTITEADLEEASLKAMNELIQQHQLADKQIAANILKVTKGTTGPSLDDLDQQLDDLQNWLNFGVIGLHKQGD